MKIADLSEEQLDYLVAKSLNWQRQNLLTPIEIRA